MKHKIKINEEFKTFDISQWMAHTQVSNIKVKEFRDDRPIVVHKNYKGNYGRKRYYMNNSTDVIILPKKSCILKADSETGNFTGNAMYNFLNTKEEIISQLKLNLNKNFIPKDNFNMVVNGEYIKIPKEEIMSAINKNL